MPFPAHLDDGHSADLMKTGRHPSSTDGEIEPGGQLSPLGPVVPPEAGDPRYFQERGCGGWRQGAERSPRRASSRVVPGAFPF